MLEIPGLPDLPGLPGFEPPAPPRTFYVLRPDGVLSQITVTGDQEPVLTEGARMVSQAVYDGLKATMQEAHDRRVAELLAAEAEQKRQAYEDLRTAGIPEATARILSGFTGTAEDGES